MYKYDYKYCDNYKLVAGVDEAGRGPLAGPVAAACVIMPLEKDKIIDGINDSKKLTPKKREELYGKILKTAISYKVILINEKIIDQINILNATKLGMKQAINGLDVKPDMVLIDAVKLDIDMKSESLIKGDSLSYNIAAASILAKVTRDNYMRKQDDKYPDYNFKQHKGYATKEHINNIKKFGKCDIHRLTFLKNFIGEADE